MKKNLDRLEWLEETVDKQELIISTLDEKFNCSESKLTEEKRNGSFSIEHQSFSRKINFFPAKNDRVSIEIK